MPCSITSLQIILILMESPYSHAHYFPWSFAHSFRKLFLSFTRAYRSCRPLPIVGVIRSCDFHLLHLRTLPPLPFLPHPKSPTLAAPPAQAAAAAAANLAPIAPAASRTCVNVEPRGIARRPLEKPACRGAGGVGWEKRFFPQRSFVCAGSGSGRFPLFSISSGSVSNAAQQRQGIHSAPKITR